MVLFLLRLNLQCTNIRFMCTTHFCRYFSSCTKASIKKNVFYAKICFMYVVISMTIFKNSLVFYDFSNLINWKCKLLHRRARIENIWLFIWFERIKKDCGWSRRAYERRWHWIKRNENNKNRHQVWPLKICG